jgi:regulatory factor X 1/2/3
LNNFQEDAIVEARRQQPTQRRETTGQLDDQDGPAVIVEDQHQQYLSELSPTLGEFPDFTENIAELAGISEHDISVFLGAYREHCEAILDVVLHLQFQMVDQLWQNFWGISVPESQTDYVQPLPLPKLLSLCESSYFIQYLSSCDHILYQAIVDTLIPDVLKPIPGTLTQAIRNFAKSLEGWITTALNIYPKKFVASKVSAVVAFSQTLRRYTSLNHLAQAARAVLQNSSQVSQMLNDLNRVDFGNVQEQASWVCQCEEGMVSGVEQDFKLTLQKETSLEDWAKWLDTVVSQALKQHDGSPSFSKAARQFLLKWSFYSSMVIRDLTLRSAASFGSFHLIRLLFDEYMFYLVEHKVAIATSKTPIAIMSEFSGMTSTAVSDGTGTNQSEFQEREPPAKKSRPLAD